MGENPIIALLSLLEGELSFRRWANFLKGLEFRERHESNDYGIVQQLLGFLKIWKNH